MTPDINNSRNSISPDLFIPNQRVVLQDLSDEVLLMIFEKLNAKEVGRLSLVNKFIQNLANDEGLWKSLSQQAFPRFKRSEESETWKATYQTFSRKPEPLDPSVVIPNYEENKQRVIEGINNMLTTMTTAEQAGFLQAVASYFSQLQRLA